MTTIEGEKPDLSFTEDPKWIAERGLLWERYCDSKYSELRKEKLRVRKVFFFTGDFEKPQDNGRGQSIFLKARINDFPLRRPEGWDYVVYKYGGFNNAEMTKLLVYQVLASSIPLGWSLEEELALWDHFLPETYTPIVRTPGPTKKHGVPLEGRLSAEDVFPVYLSGLDGLLAGYEDRSAKYIYRSKFLISFVKSIDEECFNNVEEMELNLNMLFEMLKKDRSNVLPQYLADFVLFCDEVSGSMDDLDLAPSVRKVWKDAKS